MVTRCDAAALLAALEAAAARLEANVDEVNALNVYPVPDGDTGTNMLHTMRTALQHARGAGPEPAALLAAAAHGALMGARGNSGVLLSQIIRGVKDSWGAEGADLKTAFRLAREYTFAAVTQPAPGTMLSALAQMQEAVDQMKGGAEQLLGAAVDRGRAAVDRTMHDNPVNKAAGVVDAGARGLWLLLDGALAALQGRYVAEGGPWRSDSLRNSPASAVRAHASASSAGSTLARQSAEPAPDVPPSWAGAYDVQCLIASPSRPAVELRAEMLEFGADCVLVVGDQTVAKVHVHTLHPHEIIRIAASAGRITDVVVEDLDALCAPHVADAGVVAPSAARGTAALAVVAVVPGDGLGRIAASLGAEVLHGGPTMNPSTAELLDAITRANARQVVLLPNDKNVVLAAEQAAKVAAGVTVTVLPAWNVAQGMAALASWDQGEAPEEAVATMRDAAERAHAIEVTTAIRDADMDGQHVRTGEYLALLDGTLVAHAGDELAALAAAAETLTGTGLLTLYVGSGVDDARRDAAAGRLRMTFPDAEVEVVDGGQPHYPFIVAAE
ncbi:MAG: DAK2 domain-containing protein [Candidatus Limnocylindria bacterium]